MKLPSIRISFHEAAATFRRFPLVIGDAALGTGAALVITDHEGPAGPTILFNVLLAAVLGIPLLTTLALLAERRGLGRVAALGLQLVGVVLLIAYGFTIPTDLSHAPLVARFQFVILLVALHLLLAAAPFAGKGEINGFWQFNKALLLRLLTSLLYTLVLYAGLAIALAALENLFGLSIPGKRYGELWILINGLFTTWFVLAGVPGNLAELDTMTDYPKGLRVFAQYILFPIVLIYFVILYAYLAKILIDWDWPQGWVSKLILGFSGAGIFLLLLLFPVVGRAGSIWITRAARWFYITLVPLVVMLFLAVWRRVSEYGITEGRYLAIALGVWLLFLILYFTLSKVKSVRLIPASLCTLAFIVSFGPWGTFSVSRESQIGRLKKLAEDAGMFADGKIRPIHGEISFEHAKQISAVLSYLQEIHGFEGIQSWFDQSLKDDAIPSGVAYKSPNVVARMMGMEYVVRWAEAAAGTIVLNADAAFDPSGYDRMVHMLLYSGGAQRVEILPDGIAYRVSEGMEKLTFAEIDGGRDLLEIDLRRHAEGLLQKYRTSATGRIPNEEMAVRAAGNGLSVQVCPWQIQCQQHEGGTKLFRIDAVILYSGKRKAVE